MAGEEVGRVTRLLLPPLLARLRRQDLAGAAGVDVFVANSAHVAERIRRYYGRDSEIVHPPVHVEHFLGLRRAPRDYYLAFGRVVPYKRVDLAVGACASLGRPLRVAGDGRALEAVRARAARALTGSSCSARSPTASATRCWPARARCCSRARRTSGSCRSRRRRPGVPVVAYGVGGAVETVTDGRHRGAVRRAGRARASPRRSSASRRWRSTSAPSARTPSASVARASASSSPG